MSQNSRILSAIVATLLGCAVLSCSCEPRRPTPPKTFSDPSATPSTAAADPTLVGDYYAGDGLGYNLALSLHDDRSFQCTWTGCLGVYGTAAGWWHRENDRVHFVTREAKDNLVGYLTWADVVSGDKHPALVRHQDRELYDKRGLRSGLVLQRYERRASAATRPAT